MWNACLASVPVGANLRGSNPEPSRLKSTQYKSVKSADKPDFVHPVARM